LIRIVDLSHVITPGKAGRKFAIEMVGAETVNPNVVRLEGQWYIMHNISMVSHIGTHIEAPYHLFKSKADLAGLPLEQLKSESICMISVSPGAGSTRCHAGRCEPLDLDRLSIPEARSARLPSSLV